MFNLRQLIILITVSLALAENFQLDCQITPAVCNHVCYSINCKKSKFVLNYDSNAANQHRRSLDSGCALQNNPCGMTKGLSFNNFCSEYPYASAAQGGKGAIMRCVTESEYNNEVEQLNSFYKDLPDGSKFSTAVVNFTDSPYCLNAENCLPDGFEFTLVNQNFVGARRSDELFVPAYPESNASVRGPFRKFMGLDGQERLWISSDLNGTLVGEYVWNGIGEKVLITSEITQAP